MARLEAQIQELGEAQKKWEKETQEEFEGIQKEQERVVAELNKKISDYKAELDDLAEFTKHKVRVRVGVSVRQAAHIIGRGDSHPVALARTP